MKYKIFLIIIVLFFICCRTIKISTENYQSVYTDTYVSYIQDSAILKKTQKFELIFINDTICNFKHTFFCNDIDYEYRIIEQKCKYVIKKDTLLARQKDTLIVTNLQPKFADCLYIDIPPQRSKKCWFLTEKAHKNNYIGCIGYCPRPPYILYGIIPNIINDTLFFNGNNKIIFEKVNINKTPFERGDRDIIYCEFRKQ